METKKMITIIDYGIGNLGSIKNMFRRISVKAEIVSDPDAIARASKILLPGVGSFDAAIRTLEARGIKEILDHKVVQEQVPILGICLGMQLLTNGSEEGKLPGFGWIDAETKRIPSGPGLKIPHMGWNSVQKTTESLMTQGLDQEARFYFVHSYAVTAKDPKTMILETEYGVKFASAIQNKNVFGMQFHPEKSHKFGMQIFKNFQALPC